MTKRSWNILVRTAHIAVMGVLLGGHAFDVERSRLEPILYGVIGTGVVLIALESSFKPLWLHQGRGLFTLAKLALVSLVPLLWNQRLALLLAVVAVASVGSHMTSRWRYYSVIEKKVIPDGSGPGPKTTPNGP